MLNIIRWEYEHEKKACDKYRADVMKNKSGAESNLKTQRYWRNAWFNRHNHYMQRINELSPCATEEQIRRAEEYCEKKSSWIYDENESEWVNSFKKYSNSDSKLKKRA